MKAIFASADEYLKTSDWKELAILKFCLLALGLLAGTAVAESRKEKARIAAAVVFTITYIPLMTRYLSILIKHQKPTE